MKCFSQEWCNLNWSDWVPIESVSHTGSTPFTIPSEPGVYRIRIKRPKRIAYIGECGDLARRIVGTWRRLGYWSPPDFSSGEPAARRLARLREAHDLDFEISWCASVYNRRRDRRLTDEQWRRGLEAHLLWQCRREMRVSSIANHGRATLREGKQLGSQELQVGYPAQVRPSSSPLPAPERLPSDRLWMGRRWTRLRRCGEIVRRETWDGSSRGLRESGKTVPVLYKALAPGTEELLKVGFTSRGSAGVRAAARQIAGKPMMAWAPLPRGVHHSSHLWRELRDDLIGGYFYQAGEAPAYQFSSTRRSRAARLRKRMERSRRQALFEPRNGE